jgi:outer membrane protein TolC
MARPLSPAIAHLVALTLGLALAIEAAATNGAPPSTRLDLTASLRLAEGRSPVLQQSRLALENARAEELNAKVAWFPSLDVSSSAGLANGDRTHALRLALTETLYDNHESITTWKVARLRREIAEQSFVQAREQLFLDVAREFLRLSQLRKLLEVRQEQNRLIIEQYQLLDLQYRQGLKTREDFLRIRSQRMRSELDLVNLGNQVRQSRVDLLRLAGENPETSGLEFLEIDPEKEPIRDVPTAAPKLRERFPTFLAFEARNRVLSVQRYQVDRRFWPNLSLTGSVSYDNTGAWSGASPFSSTGGWNTAATLALTWNLVDWGLRSRNQAIAERNLLIENERIRQETITTHSETERLQLELVRLQALFKVNSELVRSESESYAALNENYRRGQIRFLDLITGLRDFADARIQWMSVYFQLRSAVLQHAFFEARLHETLLP